MLFSSRGSMSSISKSCHLATAIRMAYELGTPSSMPSLKVSGPKFHIRHGPTPYLSHQVATASSTLGTTNPTWLGGPRLLIMLLSPCHEVGAVGQTVGVRTSTEPMASHATYKRPAASVARPAKGLSGPG